MNIQLAVPADAEAITRIYMESAEHHLRIDPERNQIPDPSEIVERYRSGRQHPESESRNITLVAEVDGQVLGFLDAHLTKLFDPMFRPAVYCYVADIAVAASHRSLGIGDRLMREVEQWARDQGAEFVLLDYHVGNPRAAEFYEKLGYRNAAVRAVKRL